MGSAQLNFVELSQAFADKQKGPRGFNRKETDTTPENKMGTGVSPPIYLRGFSSLKFGLFSFRRLFQLGRRFGLARASQVRGVGTFVGLDVFEPALAVAHCIELRAFRAPMGRPFDWHCSPPSVEYLRLPIAQAANRRPL
jgi:hypothetical protein